MDISIITISVSQVDVDTFQHRMALFKGVIKSLISFLQIGITNKYSTANS